MTSISLQRFYEIRNAQKTLLEVANHERKENIYSDILAFFLKPNEAHELKTNVLTALLELANEPNCISSPESVYVSREFGTEKGNRIDIFIHTGNHVIGIENKINHFLENDLDDYNKMLEDYAEGLKVVRIILAFEKVKIPKEYQETYKLENNAIVVNEDKDKTWKIILYKELFEKLKTDATKDFRLQQLITSTEPFVFSDELKKFHEDKKQCLVPYQTKLKSDIGLANWITWGEGDTKDEKLSDGCSVYYNHNQFKGSNIEIYAYATFKKTEAEDCEIVWHVGLQLKGNNGRGSVSSYLFKLFYKQPGEWLKVYKYNTGNGRAGKYRVYCKETEIKVIVKELLDLKELVESNLKEQS